MNRRRKKVNLSCCKMNWHDLSTSSFQMLVKGGGTGFVVKRPYIVVIVLEHFTIDG